MSGIEGEVLTVYRCPDHGLRPSAIGRGPWMCDFFVTNALCRQPVEPVLMVPAQEQPRVQRMEARQDDLILYWPNGDPAINFQRDGFIHIGAHPPDTVVMHLGPDVIEALRRWCAERG